MAREFKVRRGIGRDRLDLAGEEGVEEGVASLEVGVVFCGGSMASSMIVSNFVDISLLLLSAGVSLWEVLGCVIVGVVRGVSR